jgi:hypothetical protein
MATREDYARWLGTPSAALAGRLLRRLGEDVVETQLDGRAVWLRAADLEELGAAEPEGVVRLLPAFDQHVVAAPRDAIAVRIETFGRLSKAVRTAAEQEAARLASHLGGPLELTWK